LVTVVAARSTTAVAVAARSTTAVVVAATQKLVKRSQASRYGHQCPLGLISFVVAPVLVLPELRGRE
jgi:hypothetical protein